MLKVLGACDLSLLRIFLLLGMPQTSHVPRLWQAPPFRFAHTSVLPLTKILMRMPLGATAPSPNDDASADTLVFALGSYNASTVGLISSFQ